MAQESKASQAKNGDTVKIHYTGRLTDGTVFDTSRERDPLEFTLGEGQVIPGFEDGVTGMSPGDKKTIKISADQAYGARHDELVLEVGRDQLPPDMSPQVGQHLQSQQPDGEVITFRVTQVNDKSITVDANHPLAGQDLTFDVELVSID